jgi:AcrR family transcriptional regulator
MSGATTRQLILEAAVTSIEKYGLEKATTRRIAKEAGTNLASINYHFRTKDDLIAEALSMTIQHMLEDVHAAIAAPDRPLAATIEDVFYYLIEGAGRFPGVTTAHLHVVLVRKEYDSPAGQAIRGVFRRLLQRAADEYPDDDPDELGFSLSQVSSALLLAMLAPGYLPIADRYRPDDERGCRALARRYTAMLFAAWGKG